MEVNKENRSMIGPDPREDGDHYKESLNRSSPSLPRASNDTAPDQSTHSVRHVVTSQDEITNMFNGKEKGFMFAGAKHNRQNECLDG